MQGAEENIQKKLQLMSAGGKRENIAFMKQGEALKRERTIRKSFRKEK